MNNQNNFNRKVIKLIIELDGDAHGDYHKIEEDKSRDKFLEISGFTVKN